MSRHLRIIKMLLMQADCIGTFTVEACGHISEMYRAGEIDKKTRDSLMMLFLPERFTNQIESIIEQQYIIEHVPAPVVDNTGLFKGSVVLLGAGIILVGLIMSLVGLII